MPSTKGKGLVTKKEQWYFCLCALSNIAGLVYLCTGIRWYWGVLIIAVFALIQFFLHGLSLAQIRANGIKLSPRQFPDTYTRISRMAEEMGLRKVPTVFVTQSGGVLNAFATRFARRNFIVLLSGVFELAKDNPHHLDFIIAHELSHIKRRHISKHMLIGLASLIPFLAKAYSRACELTSDRMAYTYTNSRSSAVEGLLILAAGSRLFHEVNIDEYLSQAQLERGFFVWLMNVLSTHPPLPKRIRAIEEFVARQQLNSDVGLGMYIV